MRILNSCAVQQVWNSQPWVPTHLAVAHFLCLTAPISQYIHAAWCFYSCELACCSIECVLLSCFYVLPGIFVVMQCFVVALSAVFCVFNAMNNNV